MPTGFFIFCSHADPCRLPRTWFDMLRIAIPNKGRLNLDARSVLTDAGLEVRSSSDRALVASLGGEFEAIFVRAQDIPEFVADGAADAGITGWDLTAESGRDIESRLDLEFGRCRLVLAVREESSVRAVADIPQGARVATVFPNLTRRYFAAAAKDVELVPMSGAVEISPHLGIADIIVDLTSTGSTLRVNGLREVDTVLESTARLVIARRARDEARERTLDELTASLASVLAARDRRYVMANVPRARLADVKRILPGISGPTVIDVMNGGSMVAVHAVAPAASIYRTINELKSVGGEGILVTRIERLMA